MIPAANTDAAAGGRPATLRRLPVLFVLAGLAAAEPPGLDPGIDAELAAIVREFRGDNDRFGVLFARFDGGGGTDVFVSGDVRPDDHLRLASVSKVFLSYMFLREGLEPGMPIAAYFPPETFPRADRITARQLLNHTSGIPDEIARRVRDFGDEVDPETVGRAVRRMMAEPAPHQDERIAALYNDDTGFDFEPGTAWCYSNTGFMMLGRMLERASGRPLDTLLADHFGRVAPSLYLDDGRDARYPASYVAPWPIHFSRPWIAGGLVATAGDALAAFHHISEQPEFETMQQWAEAPRCNVEIVAGDDYGLGVQRYAFGEPGDGIGHDGHIIARSLMFRLGDASYFVHVTRFVSNADLREMAGRLLRSQRSAR